MMMMMMMMTVDPSPPSGDPDPRHSCVGRSVLSSPTRDLPVPACLPPLSCSVIIRYENYFQTVDPAGILAHLGKSKHL